MDSPSGRGAPAEAPTSLLARASQRGRPRHRLRSLVYVVLDQGNGGIVRDLSEDGLALQSVTALQPHQQVHLRFELLNPRVRVDAAGQVMWAKPSGNAGVQLTQVSPRMRQQLKEWLLTNLLADASSNSLSSPVFRDPNHNDHRSQLILGGEARSVIPIDPAEFEGEGAKLREVLHFSWWPNPVAAISFARLVDRLIVLTSVLLFEVVFLAMTHELLSWLEMAAVAVGVGVLFGAVYWFLFAAMGVSTPGWLLAKIAQETPTNELASEQELARFR
jgi:hypothetical protein